MKRSIFGSGRIHPAASTGAFALALAVGFASSGAGESCPATIKVASVRHVRLRGIGGMIRPSQSIYLCIVTRIGRFSAENRLVPDHIHLCRFPLYSYRETGYKSKKQRDRKSTRLNSSH